MRKREKKKNWETLEKWRKVKGWGKWISRKKKRDEIKYEEKENERKEER